MGRLPDTYLDRAGKRRKIMRRMPYSMGASIDVLSSEPGRQFPAASFLHNVDMPFEVHRLVPRVIGVDASDPTQVVLPLVEGDRFISFRVTEFGKKENEVLTKASTLVPSVIKSNTEHTWEWTEPNYLQKSEGYTVRIDSSVFDDSEVIWRTQFLFQGYLLVLAEGK